MTLLLLYLDTKHLLDQLNKYVATLHLKLWSLQSVSLVIDVRRIELEKRGSLFEK